MATRRDFIQRDSTHRVIEAISRLGVARTDELARETGLSRSTVIAITRELANEGIVQRAPGEPSRRAGRPSALISLSAPLGLAAAIDIGHYWIRVGWADERGHIPASREEPKKGDTFAADLRDAVQYLAELLEEEEREASELRGVGLAVPAPIDAITGEVASTTFLKGWPQEPIQPRLEALIREKLGVPLSVYVDNDATCCAASELRYGDARGRENVVVIKASGGIGAGLIVNGEVFAGARGLAGELGHAAVAPLGKEDAASLEACPRCQTVGCLESVASGPAMLEWLVKTYPEEFADKYERGKLTVDGVIANAKSGDHPKCLEALSRAGRYLGVAVANIVSVLNPEQILIAGALSQAGNDLLNPLREEVERRVPTAFTKDLEIAAVREWKGCGLRGAAALVLQNSELDLHQRSA